MKIGILGGTFNPVHLGHLLLARDALEQAGLDRVKFIPCARPPHKQAPRLAPAVDRLALVRLAVRGEARFEVDDLEIRRGGRSYSVDTLRELRRRRPGDRYFLIIGSDSLRDLSLWRDVGELFGMCRLIAVARPGFDPGPAAAIPLGNRGSGLVRLRVVRGHGCDISSTDIRARLARGKSVRYLVPESVRSYIDRQKLYR